MKAKSRTAKYYRENNDARLRRIAQQKRYQKKPEQVEKRVELNREARKRGIYGKREAMGKDLSHQKGNKGLVLESLHKNRARNRGKK